MRTPSKYQEAIYAWIEAACLKPRAALVVDAKAGSGKSTTIVETLKLIPATQSVLFLAFNRHIADELKRRVPENVEAATMNSFGWRALRAAVRGVLLNDDKTDNIIKDEVPDREEQKAWRGAIKRLVSLKKATRLSAEEIIKKYDLELPTDARFMEACGRVWKKAVDQCMVADFDDQVFQVVTRKLEIPTYDWVMVDESQDLSQVQIDLVKRIAPRIVAVGDPHQGIYAFRGADLDAMTKIKEAIGADVLPLSISYRCPKEVVRDAQRLVPEIEWAPEAKEGIVETIQAKDLLAQVRAKDWVLCRTTAPLVKECLRAIVAGIKASVKGRDIGQQIIGLIDKIAKTDAVDVATFQDLLGAYGRRETERLEAAGRDVQLQALQDRIDSIEALSEGARTVGDVKRRIASVFSDEASPGVTFATVHRSKGLETLNVFIIRPDLMPFPKAKTEAQMRQEKNLKYVAITRAQERLVWVAKDPADK